MKKKLNFRPILPLVIVGFAICFSMAVNESYQQIGCNSLDEAKNIFLNNRAELEKALNSLQSITHQGENNYYYYLDLKPHIPPNELPLFEDMMEGEFRYIDITLTDNSFTACFELDASPGSAYAYYLIYTDGEPPVIAQQHIEDNWYIGFIGYT